MSLESQVHGAVRKFGRYELMEPLGSGGMGIVYRALDTRIGREVALKVMDERRLASARAVSRFEQEARLAGALNHPNVLAVFDAGEHQGVPFLVTELLEGQTLRQRLAGGPLQWREALALCLQAAEGLAAAHARGIIHRDLKPENLFLTLDGRVKILDFGVAKLLEGAGQDSGDPQLPTGAAPASAAPGAAPGAASEEITLDSRTRDPDSAGPAVVGGLPVHTLTAEGGGLTSTGAALGTPAYMSPEQVRGERASARSDVFAFGCVAHEMLSGERPFGGKSAGEMGAAILTAPPRLLPAGLPGALLQVVGRCLQKKAEQRYANGASLLEALQEIVRAGGEAPAKTQRRFALPALLAGIAGAILGTVAVWVIVRQQPSAAPSGAGAAAAPTSVAPASAPAAPARDPPATPAAAPRPAVQPPAASRKPQEQRAPSASAPAAVARTVSPAAALKIATAGPAAVQAEPAATAKDPGAERVDQLLRTRKIKEAIGEAQAILARDPPRDLKRHLLKRLAQASYQDGDDDGELRYSLQYRELCPPDELPALDKRIARLRTNLGLDP